MIRLFLPALATLALAACGHAAEARPGLWAVSDADTTIYLFGTVHMLAPDTRWRTERLDGVVAKADELVVEIAPDGNAERRNQAMQKLAYGASLPPLAARVAPEKREALRALIAQSGIAPAQLDRMDTWAAAVALGGATLTTSNFSSAEGVEVKLNQSFAGKPVIGLETTEGQLGLFDAMPEALQREFLANIIDDSADAARDFGAMVSAWATGDTARIAATFNDPKRLSPAISAVLIDARNRAWADWIVKRLERPGTVLMAVGAGHLAGEGSVQALLQKQGVKVTRVQ